MLLQDFFRAQFVAAMHKRYFRGDIGQVQRFFDGRIAAADDGNRFAAVERTRRRWHKPKRRGPCTLPRIRGPRYMAVAPVEMIRCIAGVDCRSRLRAETAASARRPSLMWSLMTSVSKRSAWRRMRSINSGPCRPSTSPGQLSTSVVVISWPPCSIPVINTGFRLARAA